MFLIKLKLKAFKVKFPVFISTFHICRIPMAAAMKKETLAFKLINTENPTETEVNR